MSREPKSARPEAAIVVRLSGDLDLPEQRRLGERLNEAAEAGGPVVVDLGECTYAGASVVAAVLEAGRRARERQAGFVVVLPYSANPAVRRMVLELVPELGELAVVPSLDAAWVVLGRPVEGRSPATELSLRVREARARMWETAAELELRQADRDALRLEQRRTLASIRDRRRSH